VSLARIAGHRAWRGLPLWALASGLNTAAVMGMIYWRVAAGRPSFPPLVAAVAAWIGLAAYLAFGGTRTRCGPFEMSLPAPSRRLWLLSLVAPLAGGLVIIAFSFGVIALHRAVVTRVDVEIGGWALASLLVVGLFLATLLLQAPRPSLARIPVTVGQVVWTIVVLVGMPFLLALAASAGWPGIALLAVLAAALAVWSYRSVPPAYTLAPLEPSPAAGAASPAPLSEGGASRWVLPRTILRGVSAGAKELLAVPFVLLFAVILGGALLVDENLRELRYLYLPMTTYMLYSMIGPRLCSLHQLDFLPISRRKMTAVLIVPYLLLVCIGYAAGEFLSSGVRSRLEYVDFSKDDLGYHVTVPLRVYALAPGGEVPDVEAPWGESHPAESLRPMEHGGAILYSPYSAPPGSSARFVALQISRAAEAVYGVTIPPDVVEQRYLVTLPDGGVEPRGEGLTLRRDYPGLKPRSGPMSPVLLTLTVVPWLLLVALLLRGYRAGVPEWVRQSIVWGALFLLLIFAIGSSIGSMFRLFHAWAVRALIEIPVMLWGSTTAGTLAVWIACAALVAGAYLVVQRQFLRMEIPTRPSRYTLIDWPGA